MPPARAMMPGESSVRETFIGQAITPLDTSFATGAMAGGASGLPARFSWRGKRFAVAEVLETWKEAGDCRHGSGERYVRKHWYRIRTDEGVVMRIYFERQARCGSRARWRLYSLVDPAAGEQDPESGART